MKRRLGTFKLSTTVLRYHPEDALKAVFAGLIVIEATRHWNGNQTDYLAICDSFDEVSDDVRAPEYEALIQSESNIPEEGVTYSETYSVTWSKV